MLNFVWTNHLCKRSLLFHCVLSENSYMRYWQIQRNFGDSEYLCKLGKEYLNTLLCKFNTYLLDKICKLLTYHTPFYH